jgi:hypothetical protein
MDSYYTKRHQHVLKAVDFVYQAGYGVEKQTNYFTKMDFYFSKEYYIYESKSK